MPNQPKGRTFRERWPDDASYADWLSTPWVPIGAGGLLGFFGFPIVAARLSLLAPAVLLVPLALGLIGWWAGRQPDPWARRAGVLFTAGAFVLLVIAGGGVLSVVVATLVTSLCQPEPCSTYLGDIRVAGPAAIAVFGDAAVGIGAALVAVRLRAHYVVPRRIADPALDAWRERHLHHDGA